MVPLVPVGATAVVVGPALALVIPEAVGIGALGVAEGVVRGFAEADAEALFAGVPDGVGCAMARQHGSR